MLGPDGDIWVQRFSMVLARELSAAGWNQDEIAASMGTTQSRISRLAGRDLPTLSGTADDQAVDTAARQLATGLSTQAPGIRPLSQRVEISFTCEAAGTRTIGFDLTGQTIDVASERDTVLEGLHAVIERLHFRRIRDWVPEVGLNIAACTHGEVERITDVAAFPGRLAVVNGRLRAYSDARFGASQHLAATLLDLREKGGIHTHALLNMRAPDTVALESVAAKEHLSLARAPRGRPEAVADLLLDEGDFGWEPTLYVTAEAIPDLAARTNRLLLALQKHPSNTE